ncbi:MAG: hypothetical protein QOE93_1371 [Actinomycetota bacterium]|jgi:hypothetical protein|nr:hypothetical protein [Actinomycetota bacterium]
MTISSLRRTLQTAAVLYLMSLALALPAFAGGSSTAVIANFEGTRINLTHGWGEATACTSDGTRTDCFRSETQMDRFLGQQVHLASDCSSSLRLYSSTGFGGSVLHLTARGSWLNLWSYGFDNITSSFIVGACNSFLASGASGGGSWYPGPTTAGSSAASMLSGWDNVLSSAFIT